MPAAQSGREASDQRDIGARAVPPQAGTRAGGAQRPLQFRHILGESVSAPSEAVAAAGAEALQMLKVLLFVTRLQY